MVPLRPVYNSTNIAAQGYDPASQTLAVVFHSGGFRYDYLAVPAQVAEDFAKSDSPGAFLAKNIARQFEFTRLDLGEEERKLQGHDK